MNSRGRKFSEFSESMKRRTSERGRSKSDALFCSDDFPLSEDVFVRNSMDGYLPGTMRRSSSRRISFNLQNLPELPSIGNITSSRRRSSLITQPTDIPSSPFTRRRSSVYTKPTDMSLIGNNRRRSSGLTPATFMPFPPIYDSAQTETRALMKTRSTQNFSSMVKKVSGQFQTNRKGGKRMRRIISLDNFFSVPFKNRILNVKKEFWYMSPGDPCSMEH